MLHLLPICASTSVSFVIPCSASAVVLTRTPLKVVRGQLKNLSDMAKELEHIGSVTSVGDLPQKMEEAEEKKNEVEALILERNGLLAETSEEWEQCEKKIKEVRSWIEKTKTAIESQQNKKKPLRDQHGLREKMLADLQIQKTKISLSVEKLQVADHETGVRFSKFKIADPVGMAKSAEDLLGELDALNAGIKTQTAQLETAIAQVDQYQLEVQQLRQQIVQVEQQLRATMAPTYLQHDRDQALRDQQIKIFRLSFLGVGLISKPQNDKVSRLEVQIMPRPSFANAHCSRSEAKFSKTQSYP
ncbi:hypothetical protein NQ318_000613 [Aromia moschata]|uniref:Uncharacterized protein n=1 Tax=Aromia moschata TaxID=1265417 RepID=A0AAV8XSM2_9CUCU|nr:hypothetical protein NQ318_000613 [Aromia moschata]